VHAVDALPVSRGDVVCFVGGGGKTSLLQGCGRALAAAGLRAVCTTTTRLEIPALPECAAWAWDENEDRLLDRLVPLLEKSRHVTVGRRGEYADRLVAVSERFLEAALASRRIDVLLVEGDGARRRHLKAPRDGEPVVPAATTIYVPVAGMDVLGKPLTEEFVHRAEFAAKLAGVPPGTPLDAAMIAAVLLHPDGVIRATPSRARIVPFLSFCEGKEALEAAGRVARAALDCGRFDVRRVLLGTANDQQVREVVAAY
jgi:probable selenium-dependent hydroxylase accessory protein YqeC